MGHVHPSFPTTGVSGESSPSPYFYFPYWKHTELREELQDRTGARAGGMLGSQH